MPALGVALALVEVVDQSMPQGAPAVVADQRPLIGGLLRVERVLSRKEGAELLAENALVGEPGEEPAHPAPEQPLRRREAGALQDDAAVEQQRPGQLEIQPPLEIARHQLGCNGGAHVMGDDEDGPRR